MKEKIKVIIKNFILSTRELKNKIRSIWFNFYEDFYILFTYFDNYLFYPNVEKSKFFYNIKKFIWFFINFIVTFIILFVRALMHFILFLEIIYWKLTASVWRMLLAVFFYTFIDLFEKVAFIIFFKFADRFLIYLNDFIMRYSVFSKYGIYPWIDYEDFYLIPKGYVVSVMFLYSPEFFNFILCSAYMLLRFFLVNCDMYPFIRDFLLKKIHKLSIHAKEEDSFFYFYVFLLKLILIIITIIYKLDPYPLFYYSTISIFVISLCWAFVKMRTSYLEPDSD